MRPPLTSEQTWLAALSTNPPWDPPALPTIVISPHPDDETLGAGGLIALQRFRHLPVTVVAITDGEAAYPDSPGLGELRRFEQEAALAHLGVGQSATVRLQLPDSSVSECESLLLERLYPLIRPGMLVVAPWEQDPHPDHEVVGRVANELALAANATLVSYFFWTWHRKSPQELASLRLVKLPLDADRQASRASALAQYPSQLSHPTGSPVLPELLLAPARRTFESYIPRS